jgi:hypothetical protein
MLRKITGEKRGKLFWGIMTKDEEKDNKKTP